VSDFDGFFISFPVQAVQSSRQVPADPNWQSKLRVRDPRALQIIARLRYFRSTEQNAQAINLLEEERKCCIG
jgi:hypothetical protein